MKYDLLGVSAGGIVGLILFGPGCALIGVLGALVIVLFANGVTK